MYLKQTEDKYATFYMAEKKLQQGKISKKAKTK